MPWGCYLQPFKNIALFLIGIKQWVLEMRNHMHYPSMGLTPRWTPIGTRSTCALSQKCRAEQAVPEMLRLSMWPPPVHPSPSLEWGWESKDHCSVLALPGAGGGVGNGHSENASPEYHEEADRQGLATWGSSRPRKTLHAQKTRKSKMLKFWRAKWSSWQFAQFPEVFPSLYQV